LSLGDADDDDENDENDCAFERGGSGSALGYLRGGAHALGPNCFALTGCGDGHRLGGGTASGHSASAASSYASNADRFDLVMSIGY